MPKNAGLRVHKIIVRSTVSTVVVESSIMMKSPGVIQTTLLVLDSKAVLVNLDVVHTVAIDSPLIGGPANKILLMTTANGNSNQLLCLSMKCTFSTHKYIYLLI